MSICAICNADEVTSSNPDVDYCRNCFYTGAAAERTLAPLLARLTAIPGVKGDAVVWHTGGGCFNVAVRLDDGRLVTPSVAVEDDHGVWPEPGFPDEAEGEKWAIVVSATEEAWMEWDEDKIQLVQASYTADELVAKVRDLAAGVPA